MEHDPLSGIHSDYCYSSPCPFARRYGQGASVGQEVGAARLNTPMAPHERGR